MSQGREFQNAHSTRFLSYGHLGTVTYSEEEKKWKTLRNIVPQVASAHHEAVEKEEDGHCALPPRHLSSKVVFDGLATLQQDWADSRADEIHPDDNYQSDSASAGTYRRDHTIVGTAEYFQNDAFMLAGGYHVNCSKLLDFGHAISAAPQKVRSEPVYGSIAASVSGSNRESIRLVRMGDEVLQGPECNAKELSLHPPSISGNGQAYWISRGGPIQQISFAAAIGYSSTWMAVRLQSSTTIFHPLIHQEPVAPRCETSLPSETLSPSVLDANPILTIPISRTGGHSHADVAFHPQDHMKVALIDEHGNWSVWLLGGERRESLVSRFWANLVCSGKIWTWDHEKRLSSSLPYHDGWHRISWCMGSETQSDELFVCNRRTAVFYNTSGDPHSLTNLCLGHARENQMILDVQLSKSVPGHVFVLTSTCLFWLSFMAPNSGESSRSHETPRTLLVWQHFRDRGDKTLHLVLLETKLATVVFLTSWVVDLVLVFRIGLVNGDPDIPASLADPRPIFLPQHPYHIVSGRLPSSLLFCTIQFYYEGELKDRLVDPYLFKLFLLYEDLSIVEHLYSSTEPVFRPTEGVASLSTLPTPVPISLHGSPSTDTDLRDFVVPDDWYEEDSNAPAAGRCGRPRYTKERKSVLRAHRIHDWQDVYAYVTDESNSLTSNTRTQMDALFAQLADELDRSKSPGIRTLSEVLSSSLHITDVDDDSERFEELISTVSAKQSRNTRLERLPVILSDGQERHRLPSIYDFLVATHLAPLSPQAPDPVRVNKERLARRVTADLLLASTAVSPICKTAADPFNSDVVSEPATSQSADYLPSSAQTNSRRSSTPIKTPAVAEEDPIITHLRRYTTISRPTTSPMPPISTSPILTSILRHLPTSPSIDPRTYDWRTTERSLAAEHEEQLAIAAGKADPRAKRKAEKAKLARARREEARRRAAEDIAASSRSMPRVLSSQAGIPGMGSSGDGREVQSSQVRPSAWDLQAGSSQGPGMGSGRGQGMGQELPMTQPERGAFGMRSTVIGAGGIKKDKGKKRAAGF